MILLYSKLCCDILSRNTLFSTAGPLTIVGRVHIFVHIFAKFNTFFTGLLTLPAVSLFNRMIQMPLTFNVKKILIFGKSMEFYILLRATAVHTACIAYRPVVLEPLKRCARQITSKIIYVHSRLFDNYFYTEATLTVVFIIQYIKTCYKLSKNSFKQN